MDPNGGRSWIGNWVELAEGQEQGLVEDLGLGLHNQTEPRFHCLLPRRLQLSIQTPTSVGPLSVSSFSIDGVLSIAVHAHTR